MSNRQSQSEPPALTVIVPVYNAAATLGDCLRSIQASTFDDFELIVVDDGSTDESMAIARQHDIEPLRTAGRLGAGAARNLGASKATGDVLLFIDADCSAHPDTLGSVARSFDQDLDLDALFGSYDDSPTAPGVVARYKNLQHHHVHQTAAADARTFWAGCGAIRRRIFNELGGFDSERYPRPSVEDIELGYRLSDRGGRIRLIREIQVTHHKSWSLSAMLRSDLCDRGVPWTRLLLERRPAALDLNLGWRGRISVLLSVLLAVSLLAALISPVLVGLAAVCAVALVVVNGDFYGLLWGRGGVKLLATGILLHWLYHLNCAIAHAAGYWLHWRTGR